MTYNAAVDTNRGLTGGHPYATQELCYFVWEATRAGETAGLGHVEDALEAVLRSENAHFSLLWDGASATQRVLLEAFAVEPGRPYSEEYRRRHRLPPQTNVQKALTALVRNELVSSAPTAPTRSRSRSSLSGSLGRS